MAKLTKRRKDKHTGLPLWDEHAAVGTRVRVDGKWVGEIVGYQGDINPRRFGVYVVQRGGDQVDVHERRLEVI